MATKKPISYPYIPNSEPAVKNEMLKSVGAATCEEFFASLECSLCENRRI